MIRRVNYGEMFSLTREPAEAFFAESRIAGTLNFKHFADSWDGFIGSNIGYVLVNESYEKDGTAKQNGIIGGLLTKCFMTGDWIATECFWWIHPHLRGSPAGMRLFLQWEAVVKANGAQRIYVGNLHSINHQMMSDLYQRLGYVPLETHYVKII